MREIIFYLNGNSKLSVTFVAPRLEELVSYESDDMLDIEMLDATIPSPTSGLDDLGPPLTRLISEVIVDPLGSAFSCDWVFAFSCMPTLFGTCDDGSMTDSTPFRQATCSWITDLFRMRDAMEVATAKSVFNTALLLSLSDWWETWWMRGNGIEEWWSWFFLR